MKMDLSILLSSLFFIICTQLQSITGSDDASEESDSDDLNFYSFPVMDILENVVLLERFKGKASLVVNVASHCGYTDSHYSGLSLLQEMFAETNAFTVLAFPCNQFGEQEPGNHHQIYEFAYNRMGANFPMFAKVNVLNNDVPDAWTYLIERSGKPPTWNFWKYLVDHDGHVVGAWGPTITPDQLYQEIRNAVEKAVKAREEREKRQQRTDATQPKSTKTKTKEVKDEF